MATVPFRDFGGARGEMNRLFAEIPGVTAALVLMVANRGRLGYVRMAKGGVLGDPVEP